MKKPTKVICAKCQLKTVDYFYIEEHSKYDCLMGYFCSERCWKLYKKENS